MLDKVVCGADSACKSVTVKSRKVQAQHYLSMFSHAIRL